MWWPATNRATARRCVRRFRFAKGEPRESGEKNHGAAPRGSRGRAAGPAHHAQNRGHILAGSGAPLVIGLKEATASARESDEKAAAVEGEISHVLVPPPDGPAAMRPSHQQPGEGIGLSIVKRLCELLDASLEMASSTETGTTFRVVLPLRYTPASKASTAAPQ